MDAAQTIRDSVANVAQLRQEAHSKPQLHAAMLRIKSFQARRFAAGYADLLNSPDYGGATRFFLQDLYSDKDYSQRDAQFARIAGKLQLLFPKQVVATAVELARLHLLTEEMDRRMADAWQLLPESYGDDITRYIGCWKTVGRFDARDNQLRMVMDIGRELDRLTRIRGLRTMLRLMRKPATAAGMGALQNFLENGFDTFAEMAGSTSERVTHSHFFLDTIRQREGALIALLSQGDHAACEAGLRACLAGSA